MTDTVIVAIIAAVGTIVSGIFSAIIANSLTKYRIDQLEKKVDKHNNLIERTYENEKAIGVLQTEIQSIKEDVK